MAPRNPLELARWRSPKFLQGPNGLAFVGFLVSDNVAETELWREGIKQRWPETAADDALGLCGLDRVIEQAPGESLDAYRVRLQAAPELWKWAGTKTGIKNLFAVEPWAFDLGTPVTLGDLTTVLDEHEDKADNGDWYSRFVTLVNGYAYSFGPFTTDGLWSDAGDYDDGGTWDSNVTEEDLGYIRRGFRRWKAPASYPTALFITVFDQGAVDGVWGETIDTLGYYDDGGVWADEGDCIVVRFTIGHTWSDGAEGGGEPLDSWDDEGSEDTWSAWA